MVNHEIVSDPTWVFGRSYGPVPFKELETEGVEETLFNILKEQLQKDIPQNVEGVFRSYRDYSIDDNAYRLVVAWWPKSVAHIRVVGEGSNG